MIADYTPYIPKDLSELADYLAMMFLSPPTFPDPAIPQHNIDTVFFAYKEALRVSLDELGDDRYRRLLSEADILKAHFEADPEDSNGRATMAYRMIAKTRKEVEALNVQIWTERRDRMLEIVRKLDAGGLSESRRNALIDSLIQVTPHAKISDLIYKTHPELSPIEIVDEAMRRETEWQRRNA